MEINVFSESIDLLTTDVLILGFFSDERPPRGYCGFVDWRLNGVISHLMAQRKIGGTFMEKVLISPNQRIPSSKILLIGLGDLAHLTYEKLYTAGHTISKTLSEIGCDEFTLEIPGIGKCDLDPSRMATTVMSGFFDFLEGNSRPSDSPLAIYVLGEEDHLAEIILGMHKFKVDIKKRATINIREIKSGTPVS